MEELLLYIKICHKYMGLGGEDPCILNPGSEQDDQFKSNHSKYM